MKKIYTFLVASMLAFTSYAQQVKQAPQSWRLYSPQTASLQAPQKVGSLENCKEWGYYDGKNFATDMNVSCIGLGTSGTIQAGYRVTADYMLKGATIQGVRIPFNDVDVVKGLKIIILNSDYSEILTSQTVDISTLQAGAYNDVVLNNPITIDDDVVVTYEVTTEGATMDALYPLVIDETLFVTGGCLVLAGGFVSDYGPSFGTLVMKLWISEMALSDYTVDVLPTSGYTQRATENTVEFTLESNSDKDVKNVDYTITVADGETLTQHAEVEIPNGLHQKATIPVTFTAPDMIGMYNVTMQIVKVNGEDNNVNCAPVTSAFTNINRLIKRNVVMEEFTGLSCSWCPRGIAGMEKCRQAFGDRFVGMAYHLFGAETDPMAPSAYPDLKAMGLNSAPSCLVDRSGEKLDPYYGRNVDGDNDIVKLVQNYMEVPAAVGFDVNAYYAYEDKAVVKIDAEVEAAVADEYEMVYALVADGLESPAFRQSNSYCGYSLEALNVDPSDPLADFAAGGKYGSTYCTPVFNDVVIAASYANKVSMGGTLDLETGEVKSVTYSLDLPTKSTLLNAIKAANYDVYAIVMAVNSDGTVGNAIRVKVKEDGTGIDTVIRPSETEEEEARYTLDGRRTNAHNGLNIVRMKDGSTIKVLER